MDKVGETDLSLSHSKSPALDTMKRAFEGLVSSYWRGEGEPYGSSTICVAVLDQLSGAIDMANLGDSGAVLYRKGVLVACMERQQSTFNAPYQLTLSPSGKSKGSPSKADHLQIMAEEGDCLIVATDGLWDNLFPAQIERILLSNTTGPDMRVDEQGMALDLVNAARKVSLEPGGLRTPFAIESAQAGQPHYGGWAYLQRPCAICW